MPSIRCPECNHKERYDEDEDRASIRCSECGHKIRLDEFVDEDDDRPRKRSRDDDDDVPKKKKKKKKKGKSLFDTLKIAVQGLSTTFKVMMGLALLGLIVSFVHPVCYSVPMVLGLVFMFIGSIAFWIIVFNDSLSEFLLCFFIGPYAIYYLIAHWEETKGAFFLYIFGLVTALLWLCALPFHLILFSVFGWSFPGRAPPPPQRKVVIEVRELQLADLGRRQAAPAAQSADDGIEIRCASLSRPWEGNIVTNQHGLLVTPVAALHLDLDRSEPECVPRGLA